MNPLRGEPCDPIPGQVCVTRHANRPRAHEEGRSVGVGEVGATEEGNPSRQEITPAGQEGHAGQKDHHTGAQTSARVRSEPDQGCTQASARLARSQSCSG